jgi:hypothetical protein
MSDNVTKAENVSASAECRDGITAPSPMSRAEAIQRLAAMGMKARGGDGIAILMGIRSLAKRLNNQLARAHRLAARQQEEGSHA